MKKQKEQQARPVEKSRKSSQAVTSGSPESGGGSREGNAGHEKNPNTGQGQRQV